MKNIFIHVEARGHLQKDNVEIMFSIVLFVININITMLPYKTKPLKMSFAVIV